MLSGKCDIFNKLLLSHLLWLLAHAIVLLFENLMLKSGKATTYEFKHGKNPESNVNFCEQLSSKTGIPTEGFRPRAIAHRWVYKAVLESQEP